MRKANSARGHRPHGGASNGGGIGISECPECRREKETIFTTLGFVLLAARLAVVWATLWTFLASPPQMGCRRRAADL